MRRWSSAAPVAAGRLRRAAMSLMRWRRGTCRHAAVATETSLRRTRTATRSLLRSHPAPTAGACCCVAPLRVLCADSGHAAAGWLSARSAAWAQARATLRRQRRRSARRVRRRAACSTPRCARRTQSSPPSGAEEARSAPPSLRLSSSQQQQRARSPRSARPRRRLRSPRRWRATARLLLLALRTWLFPCRTSARLQPTAAALLARTSRRARRRQHARPSVRAPRAWWAAVAALLLAQP